MTRAAVLSVLTLALMTAAAPAAVAQAPKAAKPAKAVSALDRCLATPEGMSTYGMIDCIGKEVGVQDARLNRAYQAALMRLERPRQKAALQKAQRAWIAFRDADCAAYVDEDWGSMARVESNQCVLDHTRQRADELERYRAGY
ncbi:MAG: lysozyme inhibitor LprI family protein [Proteobacteria bacterium]|nr:lysozyme inhibitor LprI family protein [Pseudomonadota bacterium]